MNNEAINLALEKQKTFFASGKTKDICFRIEQLNNLKKVIINNEQKILDALHADLKKPMFEAYVSEIYFCLEEIKRYLKNINSWTKPQKVKTPWSLFPGSSYIVYEPLGVVLILTPWNHPFQLTLVPLIGAIAAGNCAIIKPSEFSINSTNLLAQLISQTFDPSYVNVIMGDAKEAQVLLEQKFDYIFFTGSPSIGKIVMEAASRNLTPLTLELGGKNPCIVDKNVLLDNAAKRILVGKFFNAGQNCTSPNYLFVHHDIKNQLIKKFKYYLKEFYGKKPSENPDYAKIINKHHFDRLVNLLNQSKIIVGGKHEGEKLYIEPTIVELDKNYANHPLMQEEIFGPILPIISYENIDHVISYINSNPRPISIYCFSNSKEPQQKIISSTSSGGMCINDITAQFSNFNLPFGGVGNSGFGRYHGKNSFLTFSNPKSIANTSRFSITFTPPYKTKFFSWIKKYLSWSVR